MTQEGKFSYDGTLVFNGLYKTKGGDDSNPSAMEDLTGFTRGEPGEERSGFEQINFSQYFEEYDDFDDDLIKVADEILAAEYREESYDRPEELVDSSGKPTSGWERSTRESYIHWDHPSYAFLQGSRGKVNNLKSQLQEDWSGEIKLDPLTIDPDYLLYLFYQYDSENRVDGIKIDRLTDARMSGTVAAHGKENEIRDSRDITEALPVISGILLNYNFKELEGTFSFHDYEITANLRTKTHDEPSGRIHIKVENSISQSPDLIRILISLYFLQRIIGHYQDWKDMDPGEKYVHPRYFAELHRRATDLPESAEYDFPLRELVKDYADKREENPDYIDDLQWGTHDHT